MRYPTQGHTRFRLVLSCLVCTGAWVLNTAAAVMALLLYAGVQ